MSACDVLVRSALFIANSTSKLFNILAIEPQYLVVYLRQLTREYVPSYQMQPRPESCRYHWLDRIPCLAPSERCPLHQRCSGSAIVIWLRTGICPANDAHAICKVTEVRLVVLGFELEQLSDCSAPQCPLTWWTAYPGRQGSSFWISSNLEGMMMDKKDQRLEGMRWDLVL
jgi:hypothetical protein